MAKVIEVVEKSINEVLEELNFTLHDLEYVKEGRNWFLRIFIDKPGGVDIEDCTLTSEKIEVVLDAIKPDPFPEAYFLEVSSPGAERVLKTEAQIQEAIGQYVHLSFYQAVDKEKFKEGTLLNVTEDTYTLEYKNKTRRETKDFSRKDVSLIRLAIEF